MVVQPTILQPRHDSILICNKNSEKCFQHVVESMHSEIRSVMGAKRGPDEYLQGVYDKVVSECLCTLQRLLYCFR